MIKLKLVKSLFIQIILIGFHLSTMMAQQDTSLDDYVITTEDLNSSLIRNLLSTKISSSQFVMIGEQHGIKEVSDFAKLTYSLAQSYGYEFFCIEADALAAKQIENNIRSKNPLETAKEKNRAFPLSIPFYNNYDDFNLLNYVVQNQGKIWGIDQTFLAQFRLNLDYLENTTQNKSLREEVAKLKKRAISSFNKAMSSKSFMPLFIFQYSDEIHNKLIGLTQEDSEKEILNQFKITKEIYMLNFGRKNYMSNLKRAHLMKQNFLKYYKSEAESSALPKVVFKLGDNHVMKGLNSANVYDIANYVSEFSISNNKRSTHIKVSGINGENKIGNPFTPSPIKSFDNTKEFPKEIQQIIQGLKKKYLILDLSQLRSTSNSYSKELLKWIYKYDVLVLIKDCKPTRPF